MELLYWRHPEIGMRLELPIKPRGSGFLRSNAQEIGTCITGNAVQVVSVTVMAVNVVTVVAVTTGPVTMVSVPLATVAGFEWPVPTHRAIFSIRDLKSKPGM